MSDVNRRIDAMLKRAGNPDPTRKSVFVSTRSKNKALEHAESKGVKHGIAVKVDGGFVVYQAYEDPAPKRSNNPRSTTLVSARASRNLAAPRPKPRQKWPRFVVEEREGAGPWMPRESFHKREDAETLAHAIHKHFPSITVRVVDSKS